MGVITFHIHILMSLVKFSWQLVLLVDVIILNLKNIACPKEMMPSFNKHKHSSEIPKDVHHINKRNKLAAVSKSLIF